MHTGSITNLIVKLFLNKPAKLMSYNIYCICNNHFETLPTVIDMNGE